MEKGTTMEVERKVAVVEGIIVATTVTIIVATTVETTVETTVATTVETTVATTVEIIEETTMAVITRIMTNITTVGEIIGKTEAVDTTILVVGTDLMAGSATIIKTEGTQADVGGRTAIELRPSLDLIKILVSVSSYTYRTFERTLRVHFSGYYLLFAHM